ncbi:hypothetical protein EVAR_61081_1 [Eumeta japonica]|uniref:Uncharacterized protein n=1 Tax=Eumeta variegata TaxID=151549 RepID=A0A4C1YR24_EUMVA|nr:hypothetical protein EVAR_61081_1 [Eumeta japonica]
MQQRLPPGYDLTGSCGQLSRVSIWMRRVRFVAFAASLSVRPHDCGPRPRDPRLSPASILENTADEHGKCRIAHVRGARRAGGAVPFPVSAVSGSRAKDDNLVDGAPRTPLAPRRAPTVDSSRREAGRGERSECLRVDVLRTRLNLETHKPFVRNDPQRAKYLCAAPRSPTWSRLYLVVPTCTYVKPDDCIEKYLTL